MNLSFVATPDFQSYAIVNSDSYWNYFGNFWPVTSSSPGQTRDYDLKLYLNQNHLPRFGSFQAIAAGGIQISFNASAVDLQSGPIHSLKMVVSLNKNFPVAVNMLYIAAVFSDNSRFQPVSFGPIYLVSGFDGQSTSAGGSTGQPSFAFEDTKNRGYVVNLLAIASGSSVLPTPEPSSVCVYVDLAGSPSSSSVGSNSLCNLANVNIGPLQTLALRPGQSTSLNLSLSLTTSLGVYLGLYTTPPPGIPFTVTLSPNNVVLKQAEIHQVKLTVLGKSPGIGWAFINIGATALDGASTGTATVYSFPIIVVVSS
jgi:hypothetical protein